MRFNAKEKKLLLELRGVGPTVIQRFEEIGIGSLKELAKYDTDEIVGQVADMLKTTCWKNSPQANAAISASIELAKGEAG